MAKFEAKAQKRRNLINCLKFLSLNGEIIVFHSEGCCSIIGCTIGSGARDMNTGLAIPRKMAPEIKAMV